MRQSKLFSKTRKEISGEETAKNAQLLIKAGYIHKEMAGVYAFLPLGLRVLSNIIEVIRQEMNAIGGNEVTLTALQEKALWESTDRWDDDKVDVWFKTKLKNETEVGLGVTHEEPMTRMMKEHVRSYRDLPSFAYQFQTKFRNETRAKSGIMRTREFIMKDLYSFCATKEEQEKYYEIVKAAYTKVFNRLGIGDRTYLTFASGGIFSKYSHEFQTVCDAGEDDIYIHDGKRIAINKEVLLDEVLADLGVKRDELRVAKASEVGNIFNLGTRFSDALGMTYTDESGDRQSVWMGSYGIGPARAMGVIVESLSDERGLVWPKEIAPFDVHLLVLSKDKEGEAWREAETLYRNLTSNGVEVLLDDRDASAGEKFADSDLIGIPMRLVVSEKSLQSGGVEIKERKADHAEVVSIASVYATFQIDCEN